MNTSGPPLTARRKNSTHLTSVVVIRAFEKKSSKSHGARTVYYVICPLEKNHPKVMVQNSYLANAHNMSAKCTLRANVISKRCITGGQFFFIVVHFGSPSTLQPIFFIPRPVRQPAISSESLTFDFFPLTPTGHFQCLRTL